MKLTEMARRQAGTLALALVATAAQPAAASSPDAWEEFQQKVAKACTDLALAGDFEKASAQVDPFGTETYGTALVSGTLKKGLGEERVICVMDKKTGKAELGGESKNWVTPKPKSP
jgi:hypothetical protein